MEQPKIVKKKLVTVRCNNPFTFRKIPFAGICNKVVLEVEAIDYALKNKAFVTEHLKNGKDVPLDFINYNTYNGPSAVDDDSDVFKYQPTEIEMVGLDGKKTTINKKEEKKQTVIKIDLEAAKEKQRQEAAKKKAEEIQKQKQAEIDAQQKAYEEQLKKDEEARKAAAEKILAKAKEEADKKVELNDLLTPEEPATDFTNSDNQETKKSKYDDYSKKDKKNK